ncbi:AraC family transcriptional regulator [Antrihabitans sp. YC2-6]|uniref:AraC family transcriptional regulator n=1 Tax=Antrihabitans sp. YC2-6 TaxID=2799498 RepID=UPI0018F6B940|nr:AraC family transcriptional regulator [Antrihabitans sp. YC2-6]MBJ8345810.1 AraC family transcriptional regulator [Antrihabitans sp. YC2-6]
MNNEPRAKPTVTDPRDWDEASHAVSDAYFPHELHPLTHSTASNVEVDSMAIGPVRIAHIGWGAPVTVDTAHPGGYAVNVPLSGHLESVIGHREFVATPDSATIYPPDTPTSIRRWSESCRIIGVRFERDYLHREMNKILAGNSVPVPDQVDLRGPAGAGWLRLVQSLADRSTGPQHPLVTEQLSGALTTAFVLAAVPDEPGAARPRPRIVKRVLDEMHDDPARPWTAADMAEVAGVSVRRLQEGFREYMGVSPRDCLVDIRLRRVHEDLVRGDGIFTVADIAMRWGFTHTGRFAAAYRQKYGEAPSETLRG